jgi:hypothetical protein
MMSQVDILKMFWNDWGNHDLAYYKQYVTFDSITKDQFKEITGVDYVS